MNPRATKPHPDSWKDSQFIYICLAMIPIRAIFLETYEKDEVTGE